MGFTQRFSARMLRPYCHDCLGGCYNSDATGFDITEKDDRAPAIPLFADQN